MFSRGTPLHLEASRQECSPEEPRFTWRPADRNVLQRNPASPGGQQTGMFSRGTPPHLEASRQHIVLREGGREEKRVGGEGVEGGRRRRRRSRGREEKEEKE
ncbi:hypothetical protein NHX12_000859 [Muraenolepis orangiensis]|uniref:Uncharacterized protein n=1 Tax=Muraenolepis orangiensis TaxID=630683 RepID=A0A9Q0E110_9TELE|nr:hypothetical protein NHX12_000859 [Muraenolepis orangiensis]